MRKGMRNVPVSSIEEFSRETVTGNNGSVEVDKFFRRYASVSFRCLWKDFHTQRKQPFTNGRNLDVYLKDFRNQPARAAKIAKLVNG
jgi:hypothetical protein